MWEQISTFLPYIITMVLGMGGVLLVIKKYMNPAKEVAELVLLMIQVLEDGKIEKNEMEMVIKEAKDIGSAIKALSRSKSG